MPDSTTVVLGLISSKFPELESRDGLLARIEQATEFVPIERLGLSPQCGFASTAPGNLITWDDQRASSSSWSRSPTRSGKIVTATSGILGR